MKFTVIYAFIISAIITFESKSQTDIANSHKAKDNTFLNDLLFSAGYNYCNKSFLDLGIRYYPLNNDGQVAMNFSGFSLGTEINFVKNVNTFIPYLGWQGQYMFLAYGLRTEYGINRNYSAFGLTPELGLSVLEVLRITAGYRFVLENHDPLDLSGFRFSLIVAFPLAVIRNK